MKNSEPCEWYESAEIDDACGNSNIGHRCADCDSDGFCESCDTFEGRFLEAIYEYASTCDQCHELTHHNLQESDPNNPTLGYCENCRPDLFAKGKQ